MEKIMRGFWGAIDPFMNWMFKGWDPLKKPDVPEKWIVELEETFKGFLMCCFLSLWDVGMLFAPEGFQWMKILGIIWPITSVGWMIYRIQYDMKRDGHDLATELILLWKIGDN